MNSETKHDMKVFSNPLFGDVRTFVIDDIPWFVAVDVCDALDIALAEMSMNKNRTPSEIECYAANGMAINEINIDSFQYVVNTALG